MLGLYVMIVTFLHHWCRWRRRSSEELETEPDWELPPTVMTKFRHRGTGLELESITVRRIFGFWSPHLASARACLLRTI